MNALSASDIMTTDEVLSILQDLAMRLERSKRNGKLSVHLWMRIIVFRLSTFCGLRRAEMAQLKLRDVTTTGPRPSIRCPKRIVKGRTRMRTVPLWWDRGNMAAMDAWVMFRRERQGGKDADPVVPAMRGERVGMHQCGDGLAHIFKHSIKCLGPDRVRQLSIHSGRHTFASHALNVGRSLLEVRDAMGHTSLNMTSVYAHLIERPGVPDLFGVP